jgi:uncharacterized protein
MMEQSAALAPVRPPERIVLLDALRGAALLGILAANLRGFAAPFAVYMEPYKLWTDGLNLGVQFLVDVFISGKFITIFAVLFGIGFAIQMERAESRGQGHGFFLRRMAGLALFGLVHSFGIWWGDILLTYALAGPFLLLFRKASDSKLLRWANAGYWLMPAMMVIGLIAWAAGVEMPHPPETTPEQIRETVRIYSQGTVQEIFRERAREWGALNGFLPMFLPRILALFLVGVWLWRRGLISRAGEQLEWWRRARTIGCLGLPLSVAAAGIQYAVRPDFAAPTPAMAGMMVLASAAIPLMSLFYAATLVIRYEESEAWRRRLSGFADVGRMALSNYLVQSLICTGLFYSYGLGWYGRIGPALAIVPTLVIYGVQVWLSQWWLGRRSYGPAEWLWRKLTYSGTNSGAQPW